MLRLGYIALIFLLACGDLDGSSDEQMGGEDVSTDMSPEEAPSPGGDGAHPEGDDGAAPEVGDPPESLDDWEFSVSGGALLGQPWHWEAEDGELRRGNPLALGDERLWLPIYGNAQRMELQGAWRELPSEVNLLVFDGGVAGPGSVEILGFRDAPPRVESFELFRCDAQVLAILHGDRGRQAWVFLLDEQGNQQAVLQWFATGDLGSQVHLGTPLCEGEPWILPVDGEGELVIQGDGEQRFVLDARQTLNKTLLVDLSVALDDGGIKVHSATDMRMSHLRRGPEQMVYAIGTASQGREQEHISVSRGEQWVYRYDFQKGSGGNLTTKAWSPDTEIRDLAVAPDGAFAILSEQALPSEDPMTQLSYFSFDGGNVWELRSQHWWGDALHISQEGTLAMMGRYRDLTELGIKREAVGVQDGFLASLSPERGGLISLGTVGESGLRATPGLGIHRASIQEYCDTGETVRAHAAQFQVGDKVMGLALGQKVCESPVVQRQGLWQWHLSARANPGADYWISVDGGLEVEGLAWPLGSHSGWLNLAFDQPQSAR